MFFIIYLVGFIIVFGITMGFGMYTKDPKCDANSTFIIAIMWPAVLVAMITYGILKCFKAW